MSKSFSSDSRKGSSLQDGQAHAEAHKTYTRRSFLGQLGMVGAGSFLFGRFPISPLAASPLTYALDNALEERILVLIQLKGGNDGLNTILPLYDYGLYKERRPTLAVPIQDAYVLSPGHGMPPFMAQLQGLWEKGQMKVVHSVGYPDQNLSHFRSTDIWTSASDAHILDQTGWLGRWMESEYPDFLLSPPVKPPALQIGANGGLTFEGSAINMSVAVTNPTELYEIAKKGALYDTSSVPENCYGDELRFLRAVANNTFSYAGVIKEAFDKGNNNFEYAGKSYLAEQLALVSKLIQGGLGTRLYLVSLDGFDTHAEQEAYHPRLMREVSTAIQAFYQDLEKTGYDRQVLAMTFSEFGRRIEENGSRGTDHGSAAPLLLFGPGLQGNGLIGKQPNLRVPDQFGNLDYGTDFRSVYATVLEQWLCLDPQLVNGVMGQAFERVNGLGLVCAEYPYPASGPEFVHRVQYDRSTGQVSLHYSLPMESDLGIQLLNLAGQPVRQIGKQSKSSGLHQQALDLSGLPMGTYLYRIETLGQFFSGKLIVGL